MATLAVDSGRLEFSVDLETGVGHGPPQFTSVRERLLMRMASQIFSTSSQWHVPSVSIWIAIESSNDIFECFVIISSDRNRLVEPPPTVLDKALLRNSL